MKENTREWVKAITSASVVAMIVVQFVVPTSIFGSSMEPNFEHRDYLLVNKQAYGDVRKPQKGDVVVFLSHLKDNRGEEKKLIKRVIGVPGDTVAVEDGIVYINGKALKEDYIKDGTTNGTVRPVMVPKGSYFCLGDNRLHSTDSRFMEIGFVDEKNIIGKVFFRLYPFDKIGIIGS